MHRLTRRNKPKIVQTSDNEDFEDESPVVVRKHIVKKEKRRERKPHKPILSYSEDVDEFEFRSEHTKQFPKKSSLAQKSDEIIRRRRLELSNESRYSIEEMNELKSSVKETPKDYIMTNEKESVIVNQLPNDQLNKETITNNVPTSISSEVSRMIDQGLPEEYIVKEMKERKIRRQNIAMTEDNYISLETGDALYIPLKENKSLLQREDDVLDNGYGDYEAMIEDGLVITDQQKQQEAKLKEESIENAAEQIVESENNVDWGSWEAAQVRKGVYSADQQEMLRKQNRPQLAKIPTLQEQIQRLRTCIAEEKLQQDERMKQLESVLAEEREIANREQMLRDSFKALDDLSKSHIAQLNV